MINFLSASIIFLSVVFILQQIQITRLKGELITVVDSLKMVTEIVKEFKKQQEFTNDSIRMLAGIKK